MCRLKKTFEFNIALGKSMGCVISKVRVRSGSRLLTQMNRLKYVRPVTEPKSTLGKIGIQPPPFLHTQSLTPTPVSQRLWDFAYWLGRAILNYKCGYWQNFSSYQKILMVVSYLHLFYDFRSSCRTTMLLVKFLWKNAIKLRVVVINFSHQQHTI